MTGLAAVLAGGVALGYVLGRSRPLAAARRRVRLRFALGPITTRRQAYGLVVAHALLEPVSAWRIYRDYRRPQQPRPPAPRVLTPEERAERRRQREETAQ